VLLAFCFLSVGLVLAVPLADKAAPLARRPKEAAEKSKETAPKKETAEKSKGTAPKKETDQESFFTIQWPNEAAQGHYFQILLALTDPKMKEFFTDFSRFDHPLRYPAHALFFLLAGTFGIFLALYPLLVL